MPSSPDTIKLTVRRLLNANLSQIPQDIVGWASVCLEVFPHAGAEDWYRAALAHMADPKRGGFWPAPADLGRHLPLGATAHQDMTPEAAFDHCCAIVARYPQQMTSEQRVPFLAAVARLSATQSQALKAIGNLWAIRMADPHTRATLRAQFITACQLPVTVQEEQAQEQRRIGSQSMPALTALVDVPEDDRVSAAEIGALIRRHGAPRKPDAERIKHLRLVEPLSIADQEQHIADLRAHQQRLKGGE